MVDAILRKRNTPFWNVPRAWDEVRTVRKCSDVSMKVSDMTSSLKFCMSEVLQKQLLFHRLMKHQQHQGYVALTWSQTQGRCTWEGSREVALPDCLGAQWGPPSCPVLGHHLWEQINIWDPFYSALNLHVFSAEWMSKQEDSQLLKWGILAADKQTLAEL